MEEIKVLSPTAILGYGFPRDSLERGLEHKPDVIAVDGGSTDPGPYYLGAGVSFTDREAVKRDLRLILKAGKEMEIPVLVGTAGGAGARPHLQWTAGIVRELAEEQGLNLRTALLSADFEKSEVLSYLKQNRLRPLATEVELDRELVEQTTRIVGQMGLEPIMEALDRGVDLVLAGRAYDPTVFAASAVRAGFSRGLALHMGKILECASIAADPGSGSDCMLGTLDKDGFILEPMNPERRCTVTSVAAHTLYEKENPYKLKGPGGVIGLGQSDFQQLDKRRVRVEGSRFIEEETYTIKLEGARKVGYRTLSIAGTRDPIMISRIEEIVEAVKGMVRDNFNEVPEADYQLLFRVYGKDGVMGSLEPIRETRAHELGIIIEVVARTQKLADTICSFARSGMLHYGYRGRKATAGNLAFPYSPSDIKAGEVYEFSLHHLLEVEDPVLPFPLEIREYGPEGEGEE